MDYKEILNIKELSEYLNCSISLIRKMVYNNSIPFFKLGNRLMFNRSIINKWITNLYNDIEIGKFENEINGDN